MNIPLEYLLPGIGAAGTIFALVSRIIRPWWRKRQWYREMYDLVGEMMPYSPIEVQDINQNLGPDSEVYLEEYLTIMERVPDEINRKYQDEPTEANINEDFINCLCTEGYSLRRRLEEFDREGEIHYLDFLNSVHLMDAASLVIRYQIEEEVLWFRPKISSKLPNLQREHAHDLYQDYLEKDHYLGDTCSSILESYYETNNRPWSGE